VWASGLPVGSQGEESAYNLTDPSRPTASDVLAVQDACNLALDGKPIDRDLYQRVCSEGNAAALS